MSDTTNVVLGDKGRIVVPFDVRRRRDWRQGTVLILVETPDGLLLTERATALRMIREKLAGRPLVEELIAERHASAAADLVEP